MPSAGPSNFRNCGRWCLSSSFRRTPGIKLRILPCSIYASPPRPSCETHGSLEWRHVDVLFEAVLRTFFRTPEINFLNSGSSLYLCYLRGFCGMNGHANHHLSHVREVDVLANAVLTRHVCSILLTSRWKWAFPNFCHHGVRSLMLAGLTWSKFILDIPLTKCEKITAFRRIILFQLTQGWCLSFSYQLINYFIIQWIHCVIKL